MSLLQVKDRPIQVATASSTEGPDLRPLGGFRAFVRRHRLGSYLFCVLRFLDGRTDRRRNCGL